VVLSTEVLTGETVYNCRSLSSCGIRCIADSVHPPCVSVGAQDFAYGRSRPKYKSGLALPSQSDGTNLDRWGICFSRRILHCSGHIIWESGSKHVHVHVQ